MPGMTTAWTIHAPQQAVWDGLTDIPGLYAATGVKVEVLTEGPLAVGTRWKEFHSMLGRESAQEWEVTELQVPTKYRLESDSSGSHWIYDTFLVPDGDTTRVFADLDVVPGGMGARVGNVVVWPLFSLILRRSFDKFGTDFARWVEGSVQA